MLKGGEALLSRMSSGLVVHRSGMNSFACLKYFSPVHGILSASATRCSPTQGAGLQNLEGGFRRTARRNILVCNRVVGVETVTPPPGSTRRQRVSPPRRRESRPAYHGGGLHPHDLVYHGVDERDHLQVGAAEDAGVRGAEGGG